MLYIYCVSSVIIKIIYDITLSILLKIKKLRLQDKLAQI